MERHLKAWHAASTSTGQAAAQQLGTGTLSPSHLTTMLHYTLTFLIIALIAAVLGFSGIAGTAAGLAKVCFMVFLVLFLVSFFTGKRTV